MFIFPTTRHERAPMWYKANIFAIIIAFLNAMAFPAYAELNKTSGVETYENSPVQWAASDEDLLNENIQHLVDLITLWDKDETENTVAGFQKKRSVFSAQSKKLQLQTLLSEIQRQYELILVALNKQTNDFPSGELQNKHQAFIRQLEERYTALQTTISSALAVDQGTKAFEQALQDIRKELSTFRTTRKHQAFEPEKYGFLLSQGIKDLPLHPLEITRKSLEKRSASYLGEDTVVQITDEIKALAKQLDNHPAKIYKWVYENIKFVPSYGAIQGTEMTLTAKSGNTVDTNALLAALLRAAGIKTKFATGLVTLSAEQVTNWTGIADINLATDYLANGGIPTRVIIEGGKITKVELQHFWVYAYVDFMPSRGYVNGTPDTWIPMDASFKKHQFLPGIDFSKLPQFDAKRLFDEIYQNATITDKQAVISGIDVQQMQSQIQQYSDNLENYLKQNKVTNMAQLVGTLDIIPDKIDHLYATLPYHVNTIYQDSENIPEQLIHYININIKHHVGFFGGSSLGSEILNTRIALPQIGYKRLGVTYRMATPKEQGWRDNNTASFLPLYALKVIPTLMLDNEVLAQASPVQMGNDQTYTLSLIDARGRTNRDTYDVIAGDEIVVGINGNGINQAVVQKRWDTVSPHYNAAENLHQVALHYWWEADLMTFAAARGNSSFFSRKPSVGLFSSPLTVTYQFGIPKRGSYSSWSVDIPQSVVAIAGSNSNRLNAMNQSGLYSSYLESSVLEQLFSKPQGSGVSTTQLLIDAAQQNIPIFTINKDNADTLIPQLQVDQDVLTDIRQGIAKGDIVTIPQKTITKGNWSGSGYSIINPVTGSGAYLISGGLSGGFFENCSDDSSPNGEQLFDITSILWFVVLVLVIGLIIGATGVGAAPVMASIMAVFLGLGATTAARASSNPNSSNDCDESDCDEKYPDYIKYSELEPGFNWTSEEPAKAFLAMLNSVKPNRLRAHGRDNDLIRFKCAKGYAGKHTHTTYNISRTGRYAGSTQSCEACVIFNGKAKIQKLWRASKNHD